MTNLFFKLAKPLSSGSRQMQARSRYYIPFGLYGKVDFEAFHYHHVFIGTTKKYILVHVLRSQSKNILIETLTTTINIFSGPKTVFSFCIVYIFMIARRINFFTVLKITISCCETLSPIGSELSRTDLSHGIWENHAGYTCFLLQI